MYIQGEKVVIRDRTIEDTIDEDDWSKDLEVTKYDVSAGATLNMRAFSVDTLEGTHIGVCSLYNQTTVDVQIGIRIGNRSYWNLGYCTDATMLLVVWAFEHLSVERIWLKVLPENIGAIRCYEKSGFVYTGKLQLSGYLFNVMEIKRENRPFC